jgi:hypothetical protein
MLDFYKVNGTTKFGEPQLESRLPAGEQRKGRVVQHCDNGKFYR